jgi:hypothetical protein
MQRDTKKFGEPTRLAALKADDVSESESEGNKITVVINGGDINEDLD